MFYQQLCAKAKEFGEAEFWGRFAGFFMEESYFGFWKSRGNFAFKNAAKINGKAFWHLNRPILCKRHVPKPGNSAKPNSRDNMPVFALELGGLFPDLAWGFW